MRRMILSSLVLAPIVAQAQSRATPQTHFEAALNQPTATVPLAVEAANTRAALPVASLANPNSDRVSFREIIHTRMVDSTGDAALLKAGALEYTMGSLPTAASAARITRAPELALSSQDLAEQPAVTDVTVRAIVDENGVPRNVAVTQSAGSKMDRMVVASVSQYRFQPATLDNKPTWSTVAISVRIEK